MDILIGTHNESKLMRFRNVLSEIPGLRLVSLKDLGISGSIDEPYKTPDENAVHKAGYYGRLTNHITLAVDESVYADFLPEDRQPGVFVKRLNGDEREYTDTEIIRFWNDLLRGHPQKDKKFFWKIAIAYFAPQLGVWGLTNIEETTVAAESVSNIVLTGYPMGSFLIPEGKTATYSEMSEEQRKTHDKKIFKRLTEDFRLWLNGIRIF